MRRPRFSASVRTPCARGSAASATRSRAAPPGADAARQRGGGPGSAHRLLEAFDRFDDALADRFLEESLSLRSVERTVEEILLPAIDLAADREGREAEHEFGCRWATGWLHSQRRVAPPATRPDGVLL